MSESNDNQPESTESKVEPAELLFGQSNNEGTSEKAPEKGQDTETTDTELEPESDDADNQGESEHQGELYLDLDGESYPLSEIRLWKNGHMMQSDYTKAKTQVKRELEGIESLKGEFNNALAELKAVVDTPDDIDWDELKSYEPDKYIKLKELQSKRKDLAAKYKSQDASSQVDAEKEVKELYKRYPQWLDKNGEPTTDEFKEDYKLIDAYCGKEGITNAQLKNFDSKMWVSVVKAAKYDALMKKAKAKADAGLEAEGLE